MPQVGEIREASELGYHQPYKKYMWTACEKCGGSRWVPIISGQPRHQDCRPCTDKIKGKIYRGNKNSNWKGGRRIARGYVLINLQPDNLFYPMTNCNSYIYEHRLIMAQHLGRCLQPSELVHHKNGVKDDNRLANLILTTSRRHHKGYDDGYRQGYQDGQNTKIEELLKQIRLLRWQITEKEELYSERTT